MPAAAWGVSSMRGISCAGDDPRSQTFVGEEVFGDAVAVCPLSVGGTES